MHAIYNSSLCARSQDFDLLLDVAQATGTGIEVCLYFQLPYVVAAQEILEAWDWERLNSGEYELSLMTCTDEGTQRRVVRCRKIID